MTLGYTQWESTEQLSGSGQGGMSEDEARGSWMKPCEHAEEGDKLLCKERRGNRKDEEQNLYTWEAKTSAENSAGMMAIT